MIPPLRRSKNRCASGRDDKLRGSRAHRWPWLCWADRLTRRPLQKPGSSRNGGV